MIKEKSLCIALRTHFLFKAFQLVEITIADSDISSNTLISCSRTIPYEVCIVNGLRKLGELN